MAIQSQITIIAYFMIVEMKEEKNPIQWPNSVPCENEWLAKLEFLPNSIYLHHETHPVISRQTSDTRLLVDYGDSANCGMLNWVVCV